MAVVCLGRKRAAYQPQGLRVIFPMTISQFRVLESEFVLRFPFSIRMSCVLSDIPILCLSTNSRLLIQIPEILSGKWPYGDMVLLITGQSARTEMLESKKSFGKRPQQVTEYGSDV